MWIALPTGPKSNEDSTNTNWKLTKKRHIRPYLRHYVEEDQKVDLKLNYWNN